MLFVLVVLMLLTLMRLCTSVLSNLHHLVREVKAPTCTTSLVSHPSFDLTTMKRAS